MNPCLNNDNLIRQSYNCNLQNGIGDGNIITHTLLLPAIAVYFAILGKKIAS